MKRWHALVCLLVLAFVAATTPKVSAQSRCFEETQQCVDGRLLEYWTESGGLPVFGYPITAVSYRGDFPTQIFERNSFERHYENQAPYDVLLGRLGDARLKQLGRDWQTFSKADPSSAHYFAETGHAIAHEPFWQYWSSRGLELGDPGVSARESLALWGLPLSEPQTETNGSGDTVLTQWFERARFEDHGEKGVLLGLLGTETTNIGGVVPGVEPIVFEGSGSVVLPRFSPPSLYSRVVSQHTGERNFIVRSNNDKGVDALLANEIGNSSDVSALQGTEERFLEVDADGTWRITIEPIPFDPAAANGLSGSGNAVSGLFARPTAEPRPFVFTFDGKSNFIVHAVCSGGSDLGANEIGSGQVETVIEFAEGPCFWDVEADGTWSFQPK